MTLLFEQGVMQGKHEIFLEIFINFKKCIIHGFFLKKIKNSKHISQGYFQKLLETSLNVYDYAKILSIF
jgi:hypothetical protein